tara:strand:- start:1143 stop:1340 length:198 start_codon:yes stop_codon:yes gene_type:complete
MAKKIVNNVEVDLTTEEEAQRTIDAENFEKEKVERQAQIDLKASAKAKLIAGEPLTEAEANTIVL